MNPTPHSLTGVAPRVPAKSCPILIIGNGAIVKDAHLPTYLITNTGEFRASEGTVKVGTNLFPNMNAMVSGVEAEMDLNFTGKGMVYNLDTVGSGPLPAGADGITHPNYGSHLAGPGFGSGSLDQFKQSDGKYETRL